MAENVADPAPVEVGPAEARRDGVDDGLRHAEAMVRVSFAELEPRLDGLVPRFYALLFAMAPATRPLFPVNMQSQRERLSRVLRYVVEATERPDELTEFLAQLGRDHRKFAVHDEHYAVFGKALLRALAEVAGASWTLPVAAAWQRVYDHLAATMTAAAQAETGPASWAAQVVEHRRVGRDIAVVQIKTDPPVHYQAGQYISVETPQRPRIWRYFSPANAPRDDGLIELHVKAVGHGGVSRAIVISTQVGDTWRIGSPLGRLGTYVRSGRDLLLIGGGTGIAPIRAILQDLASTATPPRTDVYFGARNWDELYDLDELRSMSYRNSWLDIVPVVEEQPAAPGPQVGQLPDVVTQYGAWADREILVSGSPAMLRATIGRMITAGTPLDRMHYDPFVSG